MKIFIKEIYDFDHKRKFVFEETLNGIVSYEDNVWLIVDEKFGCFSGFGPSLKEARTAFSDDFVSAYVFLVEDKTTKMTEDAKLLKEKVLSFPLYIEKCS